MVSVTQVDFKSTERRAVVIAGMHRSGTSAMCRTLSLLGAVLPKGLMLPVESNNESGFWEPQSISNLNGAILEELDSEWDDVFAFRPRQYLSNFDSYYLGRALELVEEEFNGAELIVLKDPRISVLGSFWERVLRKAGYVTNYVIMVRNPLEVAESLRARDEFPREKSLLLWSSYMVAVERDTRGQRRTFVSYEQLMNNWRAVRKRVEDEFGFPFPRDTVTASMEIERYLEPRLHHHKRSQDDVFTSDAVWDQTKALYRIFSDACEGDGIDEAAVDAIQEELAKIDLLVGPLLADLKARARTSANELTAERDASVRVAEEKGRWAEELSSRLEAAESQRERIKLEADQKERATVALTAKLEVVSAESEQIALKAEEQRQRQMAEFQQLQAEYAAVVHELETERMAAAEALSAKLAAEGKLNNLNEEVLALRRDVDLQRGAVAKANAEVDRLKVRINERSDQIARLTELLVNRESGEKRSREELKWLREASSILLSDANRLKGRLYRLLPAALNYRRQQKLLRRKGLFDPRAYLEANPDVAESGLDPIRHYIVHGIGEGRPRGD